MSERLTDQQDEILLKAIKLLEALQEPCNGVSPGADHSWRLCRRCMAIHQFDSAPDVTSILVGRLLDVVRERLAGSAAPSHDLVHLDTDTKAGTVCGAPDMRHGGLSTSSAEYATCLACLQQRIAQSEGSPAAPSGETPQRLDVQATIEGLETLRASVRATLDEYPAEGHPLSLPMDWREANEDTVSVLDRALDLLRSLSPSSPAQET